MCNGDEVGLYTAQFSVKAVFQSKHSHYFVTVLCGQDLNSPHGPKMFADAPKTKPPKDIRAQLDGER